MELPIEAITSKSKAFKKSLQVAIECLRERDYIKAHMMFSVIFSDLQEKKFVATLNLNDLDLFSIHVCLAYTSVALGQKNFSALFMLNSMPKNIKLPLVNFLRASIHIANDCCSSARDELYNCEELIRTGYNFKPNAILNEEVVPEINDDFLKIKLNGLVFACNFVGDADNNGEEKSKFLQNWVNVGQLCDIDLIQIDVKKKKAQKVTKDDQSQKSKVEPESTTKKFTSIAVQAAPTKANAQNQTVKQKDNNKELTDTVKQIKNKLDQLQNKNSSELNQLKQKNEKLNEKIKANEISCRMHVMTADYNRDRCVALQQELDKKQNKIEFLQKLLMQQVQQKHSMQNYIYNLLEDKFKFKMSYFSEMRQIVTPVTKIQISDCNEELRKSLECLEVLRVERQIFEKDHQKLVESILKSSTDDMVYPRLNLPNFPKDDDELIYKFVRDFVKTQEIIYNGLWSTNNIDNCGDEIASQESNTYEDGRTTGSPSTSESDRVKPTKKTKNSKKKKETPIPSTSKQKPTPNLYQSEIELFEFVRKEFGQVDDLELLDMLFLIRDSNGGSLAQMSKDTLVASMRKLKSCSKKSPQWNNAGEDADEDKCVICFEDYSSFESDTLICGHIFHKTCIKKWFQRQSACPVCRIHIVEDGEFPPLR